MATKRKVKKSVKEKNGLWKTKHQKLKNVSQKVIKKMK